MRKRSRFALSVVVVAVIVSVLASGCGQQKQAAPATPAAPAETQKPAEAKYPAKEITLVCPWVAGASADLQCRAIAKVAGKYLDKPIVVVNQDGAGGVVATTQLVQAKPDGYTIALGVIGLFTTQPILNKNLGYKLEDFDFLLSVTSAPCAIVVNANSPYKTIDDMVKDATKNKKVIRYGTSGANTTPQLAGAQFFQMAGIQNQHVPFTGGAPALAALLGNKLDACSVAVSDAIPQIKAGTLRALAVTSGKRMPTLPDVPTMKEKGYDYEMTVRWYVFAPRGIPEQAKKTLTDVLQKVVADPDFKKAMDDLDIAIDVMSGEATVENFKAQIPILQKLIQSAPKQ